jgi:predicted TIM-barrel fold metal-dependent hydrolase
MMPELKVLLVGAGVTWVQTVIWRFDNEFKALRREVPWLSEEPSQYFLRNLRVSTYPLDGVPTTAAWSKVLGAQPGLEDMICFASGYPNWDADSAAAVAAKLPPAIHDKLFRENAEKLFRWSKHRRARASKPADVGVMR